MNNKQEKQDKKTNQRPVRTKKSEGAMVFAEASKDSKLIKEKYEVRSSFQRSLLAEISDKLYSKELDCEKDRKDLRSAFVLTIDGEDSKDLDDAVSLRRLFFGGWELSVHVADVSYYVPKGSLLDQEALLRGNTFYLLSDVEPMLPRKLSNGLCSLNPKEDKKTMTIKICFNNKADITRYEIFPSTISSSYRMTYKKAEKIIKGGEDPSRMLKTTLREMYKLASLLRKNRLNKGSVDFSFCEQKIILDANSEPKQIYRQDRMDSERLIEEFMLVANQVAGEFLYQNGMGLYRVHDSPPPEKYERLRIFASKRGYNFPKTPEPRDLQNFLISLEGSSLQMCAEVLTLRSMAQAVYQEENIGHFGLGFEFYAHFTSPIRRYADLVVHRLIKYYLFKDRYKGAPYSKEELNDIATRVSAQERIAMEAERDLYKIKCARYMHKFVGEIFDGIISSIANFGIFVEIVGTGIEAVIRYVDMDEYIIFDESELIAFNRKKTKLYRMGMPLKIQITKVSLQRGYIDAKENVTKKGE